jgi:hypothetical protein
VERTLALKNGAGQDAAAFPDSQDVTTTDVSSFLFNARITVSFSLKSWQIEMAMVQMILVSMNMNTIMKAIKPMKRMKVKDCFELILNKMNSWRSGFRGILQEDDWDHSWYGEIALSYIKLSRSW